MSDVAELLSGATFQLDPDQLAERLTSLPEPARRYLRTAVDDTAATSRIDAVHITQGGAFRTSPSARWLPIQAEEWQTVGEPGFVWKARFSPMPLVSLTVVESLIRGKGSGTVKAAGKLPVTNFDGPETDQSAAARWLMEAVWFPLAYLGPHIRWDAIDADAAQVTLTSRPDVTVTMRFDRTSGMPATVECERYMNRTRRRFQGCCSAFERRSGLMVPTVVKGSWLLPEGEFAFADFRLGTLELNPQP